MKPLLKLLMSRHRSEVPDTPYCCSLTYTCEPFTFKTQATCPKLDSVDDTPIVYVPGLELTVNPAFLALSAHVFASLHPGNASPHTVFAMCQASQVQFPPGAGLLHGYGLPGE